MLVVTDFFFFDPGDFLDFKASAFVTNLSSAITHSVTHTRLFLQRHEDFYDTALAGILYRSPFFPIQVELLCLNRTKNFEINSLFQ